MFPPGRAWPQADSFGGCPELAVLVRMLLGMVEGVAVCRHDCDGDAFCVGSANARCCFDAGAILDDGEIVESFVWCSG